MLNRYQAVLADAFIQPSHEYTEFVRRRLEQKEQIRQVNMPHTSALLEIVVVLGGLCNLVDRSILKNQAPDFDVWCDAVSDLLLLNTTIRILKLETPVAVYDVLDFIHQILEIDIYSHTPYIEDVELESISMTLG